MTTKFLFQSSQYFLIMFNGAMFYKCPFITPWICGSVYYIYTLFLTPTHYFRFLLWASTLYSLTSVFHLLQNQDNPWETHTKKRERRISNLDRPTFTLPTHLSDRVGHLNHDIPRLVDPSNLVCFATNCQNKFLRSEGALVGR